MAKIYGILRCGCGKELINDKLKATTYIDGGKVRCETCVVKLYKNEKSKRGNNTETDRRNRGVVHVVKRHNTRKRPSKK